MSFRPSTTDRRGQRPAGSDKPVPLASAKYLLLTTFNRDGAPLATPVRVLADGDRAYFRTSDASGTSKRLRRIDRGPGAADAQHSARRHLDPVGALEAF